MNVKADHALSWLLCIGTVLSVMLFDDPFTFTGPALASAAFLLLGVLHHARTTQWQAATVSAFGSLSAALASNLFLKCYAMRMNVHLRSFRETMDGPPAFTLADVACISHGGKIRFALALGALALAGWSLRYRPRWQGCVAFVWGLRALYGAGISI